MTTELHPDLDPSISRRFGSVADEARVKRTAAALEANGISVLRAADAAEAKRIFLGLIPDGSQVQHGASQSLAVAGITDEREKCTMDTQTETAQREVVHVEDAHIRPMMGLDVLESLPSAWIPYATVDPYILVHEAVVPITPELASLDTKHHHRGFDNLWYILEGSASTGHSTGPGGAMERARLQTGSLLKLRTGRGVWHAEGLGEDEVREGKAGTDFRSVLFWVNLARKAKSAEPSAQLLQPQDVRVRRQGDAIVRVLVGDGSPVELGTPGLILDVELPKGGAFSSSVPSGFNGFVYMLEGEASLGANRRRASRSQIAVLGPGSPLTVLDAQPGTRFLVMAGKPYGETPVYNGPYVD